MDLDQEMSRVEEMLLLGQDISEFFYGDGIDSRDPNGCTYLYCACCSGRARLAELLLDIKASINLASTAGDSPLYVACQNGHIGVIEPLLQRKADPEQSREDGTAPLYVACHSNHVDI